MQSQVYSKKFPIIRVEEYLLEELVHCVEIDRSGAFWHSVMLISVIKKKLKEHLQSQCLFWQMSLQVNLLGFVICFQPKAHKIFKGHVASLHFIKSHDFWALQLLLELLTSLLSLSPSPLTSSLPTPTLLPTHSLYLYNFHYSFHNHKQHQWYSITNDTSSATYVANSTTTTTIIPNPSSHFLHHHYQHYPPTITTMSTSWPALSTPSLHSCHLPHYHSHNQSLQTLVVSPSFKSQLSRRGNMAI